MRILSLDPGTVNFGWSVIDATKTPRIIKCGMLRSPIKELTHDLHTDVANYTNEIAWLIAKSKAEVLVCERYSTRIRGTTNEAVNIQIGVALREFLSIGGNTWLYMPMTWKAAAKKWLDGTIDPLYKECRPVPNHPTDASLIGVYYATRELRKKWPAKKNLAAQIKKTYIA